MEERLVLIKTDKMRKTNTMSRRIITMITLMPKTIPQKNTYTEYAPEVLTGHNMYIQKHEDGQVGGETKKIFPGN
jgi:hypothetical protein